LKQLIKMPFMLTHAGALRAVWLAGSCATSRTLPVSLAQLVLAPSRLMA